jgi:hypothetical protein
MTWFAVRSKVAKLDPMDSRRGGCNGVGEMERKEKGHIYSQILCERDRFSYLYS